jgi:RNA polymerase sigma factor (sigma-70 family)
VTREQSRLRRFIRRRAPSAQDVEDILQDVFAELVEANRRLMPIDHVTAWLFRLARNRIIDRFRRKEPERFGDADVVTENGEILRIEDLVPCGDAGPESAYVQQMLLRELEGALGELPEEQRRVFIGHEIEGRCAATFETVPPVPPAPPG